MIKAVLFDLSETLIGDGADEELAGAERVGVRAYRGAWFVRDPRPSEAWPVLTRCEDVVVLVGGRTESG